MTHITWTLAPSVTSPSQQLTEFLLALFVDRACRLLDSRWLPSKMEFTYREPNSAGEYETMFGRNLTFQAPANRLTAPSASFKRASPVANSLLYETLHKIAEEQLANLLPARDGVDLLHKYIIANVGFGGVDLEGGARALGLTPRQLQNRLQRGDTSFEAEVGRVRRQLAIGYLRDTELPMSEIALMLGYSELSSFTRAARAWFQKAPTDKRAELRDGQKR